MTTKQDLESINGLIAECGRLKAIHGMQAKIIQGERAEKQLYRDALQMIVAKRMSGDEAQTFAQDVMDAVDLEEGGGHETH